MKFRVIALVTMLTALFSLQALALEPFSQDFDGLNAGDPNALAADGWIVYGNVFGPDWAWWYGYGTYPAPNGSGAFCDVATDGANQFLNVYSDYQNGNHGDGTNAIIESNVFQEMTVGAGDVGETWVFQFDAMRGNLAVPSTANAYIKTLDPNAGWATTNHIKLPMDGVGGTWAGYSLSIAVDASLEGQIFQVGFTNYCSNYGDSGVYYDNVRLYVDGPVAVEGQTWGNVKSLFR